MTAPCGSCGLYPLDGHSVLRRVRLARGSSRALSFAEAAKNAPRETQS